MKKIILLLAAAIIGGTMTLSAQARRALKLNEVMVENTDNFVDDFGQRHAWIELFNSAHAPLEISSVYITDDPNNPTKYSVPLGDVNTKMPKRQHVIFWADGMPSHGTFHLNFTLRPGQDNWIGVYEADGLTLIDSITVPAALQANQTFARKADGEGTGREAWEIRNDEGESYITPSSNNIIRDTNDNVQKFLDNDEHGFIMAITAMAIVFSALLLLAVCFMIISKIGARKMAKSKAEAHGIDTTVSPAPEHDSGEEIAAIVMALHEHLNAHDTESTILTINRVKRSYSPWSSKIYSLRELPRR